MTKRSADEMLNGNIIIIDTRGDLYMGFKEGKILVSSKVLSLASTNFQAMLEKFPFTARSEPSIFGGGHNVIPFHEDDCKSMVVIMNILHLKHYAIPKEIEFQQLHNVAQICDKYDLLQSLGHWPGIWSAKLIEHMKHTDYETWLFIARVFKQDSILLKITRYLILNSTISPLGEIISGNGASIHGSVPAPLLSKCLQCLGRLHY